MIEAKLKNLLIPRALKKFPLDNISDIFRLHDHITRRHFLQLGIGSCVATGLSLDLREPWITESRQSITVNYKNFRWRINPEVFGSHGHVEWRRTDDAITIRLERASFPGTDLSVNFSARLYRRLSSWYISLTIPPIRFEASAPLEKWMSCEVPLLSKATLQQFALGKESVKFATDTLEVAVDSSFAFLFGGKGDCVELRGSYPYCGTQLLLRPEGQRNEALNAFSEEHTKGPCSFFSILNPSSLSSIQMSLRSLPRALAFHWAKVSELTGEAFDLGSGRGSVALIEGHGAVTKTRPVSDDLRSEVFQLDSAAMLVSSGTDNRELALAGKVSGVPHCLDCQSWTATIVGDDNEPFFAWFGPGRTGTVRVKARLQSVNLPIADADVCKLSVPLHPLDILLTHENPAGASDLADDRTRRKAKAESGSVIVFGKEATACFALDGADVEIQRSVDLLKLAFTFEGFDLRVKNGRGVLRRRRAHKSTKHSRHAASPKKQSIDEGCNSPLTAEGWVAGKIAVRFEPQHIAEEWSYYQDDLHSKPPAFDLPSRARVSGPSRIVFQVNDHALKPKWLQRELTVDSLTEWSDLAMLVAKRSLPPNSSFERQLGVSGIGPDTGLVEAMAKIKATIQPPSFMETALEMTGRLILSPSECAKWQVPRNSVNPNNAVLWHARLDPSGRSTVRAIWSEWMRPGQFGDGSKLLDCDKLQTDPSQRPPDLLVLEPRHHWQLVAQTSVYGLIGLRRLDEPTREPPKGDSKERPRSRVVRPETKYLSLNQFEGLFPQLKSEDSGFALVEPFEADIIMTSLGGSLAAEWNGEPLTIPVPESLPKELSGLDLPQTFNLERFVYRSYLGRDIHVETYEKGYLMPLGIRASYVELTERLFFVHPHYGYPVCYPVKRTFIVIRKPEKPLPGVYQPFDSRDFPADRILMLTKVTPDLCNPFDPKKKLVSSSSHISVYDNGSVSIDGRPGACSNIVFWPRVKTGTPGQTPGDVEFKWTLDNDQSPVISNLLFVSNSVKADAVAMQRLAEYYRTIGTASDTPWPALRTARFFGNRRRYAPTDQKTETSFDTDSWLLTTRGQLLPNAQNGGGFQEAFAIDARMEGADQPPFYPAVERAKISIQSLDRLVGTPQGTIQVRFNHNYIASGFDGQANKSQIYLDVLTPGISLGVNSNGAATGALARPNQTVAALSRKIGLVGAQATKSSSGNQPSSYIIGTDQTASPHDLSQAVAGEFSPTSFFSPDAKLLGLIRLADIIDLVSDSSLASRAPKLLETTGFGPIGAAADNAVDSLRKAVVPILDTISQSLDSDPRNPAWKKSIPVTINDTILKKLPLDSGSLSQFSSNRRSFALLYPDLDKAINAFVRSSELLSGSLKQNPLPKLSDVLVKVSDVVSDGRELTGEVEDLVRHPVPEIVQLQIEELAGEWAKLKNFSLEWYNQIGTTLSKDVTSGLVNTICDEATRLDVDSLFWGPKSEPTDEQLANFIISKGHDADATRKFLADSSSKARFATQYKQDIGCHSLVDNPLSWTESVTDSFFADSIGLPLIGSLIALKGVLPDPRRQLQNIKQELQQKVNELIHGVEYDLNSSTVAFRIESDGYAKLANSVLQVVSETLDAIPTVQDQLNITVIDQLRTAAGRGLETAQSKVVQAVLRDGDVFRAGRARPSASVIRGFADVLATRLTATARRLVESECDRLKQLLVLLGDWESAQGFAVAMKDSVNALVLSTQFALASKSGAQLKGWADIGADATFPRVVRFAVTSGFGLMRSDRFSSPDVAQILKVVSTDEDHSKVISAGEGSSKAKALKLFQDKRPDLVVRLKDAKSDFTSAAHELIKTLDLLAMSSCKLEELQFQIEAGHSWPASEDLTSILHILDDILRFRSRAVGQLGVLVGRLGAIQTVLIDGMHPERPPQELEQQKDVESLVTRLGNGFLDLTSAGKVTANSTEWKDLQKDLKFVIDGKDVPAGYATSVLNAISNADSVAKQIADQVSTAGGDGQKLALLGPNVIDYLKQVDRKLSSIGLQPVVLPLQTLSKMADAGSALLASSATIFLAINRSLETLTNGIAGQLNDIPILKLIITSEIQDKLQTLRNELHADIVELEKIKSGNSPSARVMAADHLIRDRWGAGQFSVKQPAAVQTVAFLTQLLQDILTGNVSGFLTDQAIRAMLDGLLADLRSLLNQLIPTSVDLKYDWNTRLRKFSSPPVFEFAMANTSDEDLRILSQVSVDFLSQKRSARVVSRLQPFSLKLFDIITIAFSGATYEAGDGSQGHFSAEIEKVTVDEKLKFIEALQSLFAPDSGSGPYLDLQSDGVEAGYRFAIGVVQLGTLQFINVALQVFTNIPFRSSGNGIGARVGFSLSSRARPFLIAQPPYGGGGFAQLTFREGDNGVPKLQVVLSFSFGAVVALHFGPLRGHGRVTSTIVGSSDDSIEASVEAIGEGSIGCFGICVMLQVRLISSGGNLTGSATYSMSFKVGFLTFSFSFVVSYTISGGSSSSSNSSGGSAKVTGMYGAPPLLAPAHLTTTALVSDLYEEVDVSQKRRTKAQKSLPCVHDRKIVVKAPLKSAAWNVYKKRLSLELLCD